MMLALRPSSTQTGQLPSFDSLILPARINMLASHHVFIPIAQFGARHRVAIIIVAAFLWIPRVRRHCCRDYQMFTAEDLGWSGIGNKDKCR